MWGKLATGCQPVANLVANLRRIGNLDWQSACRTCWQRRQCGLARCRIAPGQDGSLFLYDSFIHYFTPVYPDAIRINNLPHNQ
jgi:hypothetical protein